MQHLNQLRETLSTPPKIRREELPPVDMPKEHARGSGMPLRHHKLVYVYRFRKINLVIHFTVHMLYFGALGEWRKWPPEVLAPDDHMCPVFYGIETSREFKEAATKLLADIHA